MFPRAGRQRGCDTTHPLPTLRGTEAVGSWAQGVLSKATQQTSWQKSQRKIEVGGAHASKVKNSYFQALIVQDNKRKHSWDNLPPKRKKKISGSKRYLKASKAFSHVRPLVLQKESGKKHIKIHKNSSHSLSSMNTGYQTYFSILIFEIILSPILYCRNYFSTTANLKGSICLIQRVTIKSMTGVHLLALELQPMMSTSTSVSYFRKSLGRCCSGVGVKR